MTYEMIHTHTDKDGDICSVEYSSWDDRFWIQSQSEDGERGHSVWAARDQAQAIVTAIQKALGSEGTTEPEKPKEKQAAYDSFESFWDTQYDCAASDLKPIEALAFHAIARHAFEAGKAS